MTFKQSEIASEFKAKLDKNRGLKIAWSKRSSALLQFGSDIFFFMLSFYFQYYLRFHSGLHDSDIKPDLGLTVMTSLLYTSYWLLVFFFSGLYKNWYVKSPFDELFQLLKVSFFGNALFIFLILYDSSTTRMMFVYHLFFFFGGVSAGRMITRRLQRKLRIVRVIANRSVLLGKAKEVARIFENLEKSPAWGYLPVGAVLLDEGEAIEWMSEENPYRNKLPLLGTVSSIDLTIDEVKPQEIIIAGNIEESKKLLNIVNICAEKNISINIEPDLYHIFTGQTRTHNIYGIPLIEISPQLLKPWQEVIKRMFDIAFSFSVIMFGMPLWLLVALAVKLESKGPVFYKQPRVGKDEKEFWIYKFRSMVQNADKGKQKWTQVNDPRVTKLGKILRKTHLDEIPQFWNVLKGEMSIVGPRPEQPHFVRDFAQEIPYYKRRLKVRPGITGWWQVKYQAHELNVEEIENRLKDDFYYIENMSIKLDIEIVFRTVWCVLRGHGQA